VSSVRSATRLLVLATLSTLAPASLLVGDPASTTTATTRPAATSVMEALRPLKARLPSVKTVQIEEVVAANGQFGLIFTMLPAEQRKSIETATRHMVGMAGTDGTMQGQAVSLTVISFSDAQLAQSMPGLFDERFQRMRPLMMRGDVDVRTVEVTALPGLLAESASMLRATGMDTFAKRPWAIAQLRATRGTRMVELSLRNVDVPEHEMIDLMADALDRIHVLAENAPATSSPPDQRADDDE